MMRFYPFEFHPRPRWLAKEHEDKFYAIRSEVARRIATLEESDDGRCGFGSVYVCGPVRQSAGTFQVWNWRYRDETAYPSWLDAKHFADDPVGVAPGTSFADRCVIADTFVDVANAMFDPEDVRFFARPLEVVAAQPDRPAGMRRGENADVLTLDLFIGVPAPTVIDAFLDLVVRRESSAFLSPTSARVAQREVWEHVERLNAARQMLGFNLRGIRTPGRQAFRQRLQALQDAVYGPSDRQPGSFAG